MTSQQCFALSLLFAAATLSGCIAPYPDSRTRAATEAREDQQIIQNELRKLRGEMEAVQMENDALRREFDMNRRSGMDASSSELSSLRTRVDELERRIASVDAARERDKKEVIDKLAANIATALAKAPAPSAPRVVTPKPKPKSSDGLVYEHTVEPGQTLSAIAQVYGTTVKVIMDENGLDNANQLKVGQILYIPQ